MARGEVAAQRPMRVNRSSGFDPSSATRIGRRLCVRVNWRLQSYGAFLQLSQIPERHHATEDAEGS